MNASEHCFQAPVVLNRAAEKVIQENLDPESTFWSENFLWPMYLDLVAGNRFYLIGLGGLPAGHVLVALDLLAGDDELVIGRQDSAERRHREDRNNDDFSTPKMFVLVASRRLFSTRIFWHLRYLWFAATPSPSRCRRKAGKRFRCRRRSQKRFWPDKLVFKKTNWNAVVVEIKCSSVSDFVSSSWVHVSAKLVSSILLNTVALSCKQTFSFATYL